ncbi:hypothetical protein JCM18903_1057 [Psychrobacter sp. JCM 18903]|uniref:hypothetical protein n=1 Tax=Psychrobacter TaxID=497 RepID=UPI00043305EC|nr:hypothetical protein [Psychrobacter sp. JCM 18903]GAF61091.1 hypothetical protein JCM18903_1057 [Psychrobacter sp. JCM 18903]
MKKTGLNTALSTAFIIALGFGISACSGEKEGESHEVLAKDRVDKAAELARKNAPEAEKMEFPETAPAPVTEADGSVDGAATAEAGTTATADATDSDVAVAVADSAVMPANSADMPATDTAATPTADAEPATN